MAEPKPIPPIPPIPKLTLSEEEASIAGISLLATQLTYDVMLTPDDKILLKSDYGYFKVMYKFRTPFMDRFPVVFFYNKFSRKTTIVDEYIAKRYLETLLYYTYTNGNRHTHRDKKSVGPDVMNAKVIDFPFSKKVPSQSDSGILISHLSRYAILWKPGSFSVTKKYYFFGTPEEGRGIDTLPNIPSKSTSLIAYTEEYPFDIKGIIFENWKEYTDIQKYNDSVFIRHAGKPCQILLHETDTEHDLQIERVKKEKDGDFEFYGLRHFCVNNSNHDGKGKILQFVDIAVNVYQGEQTNHRSIGIEFVNKPFFIPPRPLKEDATKEEKDAYEKRKINTLKTSDKGIYINDKWGIELFIPLEFFDEEPGDGIYFTLKILTANLINSAALLAIGKDSKEKNPDGKLKDKTIATEDTTKKEITFKFVKADKFFHLATLVEFMVVNELVSGINDLSDKAVYKCVHTKDKNDFYLFENVREGEQYPFDMTQPGIITHKMISKGGGHGDGGSQGLFLYLKFVKEIKDTEIMQKMIDLLVAPKTELEKKSITVDAVSECDTATRTFIVPPKTPAKIKLSRLLDVT
ncbi:MAG: hypothetical protein K0S33_4070 [Bacteroidetes bacterium]|jgi:hypothetical protein|nr:hypothetical protein [Bacteroidota bacterium]